MAVPPLAMGLAKILIAPEFLALVGMHRREDRLQALLRKFSDAPRDVTVVSIMWNYRTGVFVGVLESAEYPQQLGEELHLAIPTFHRTDDTEVEWNRLQGEWEKEDRVAGTGAI